MQAPTGRNFEWCGYVHDTDDEDCPLVPRRLRIVDGLISGIEEISAAEAGNRILIPGGANAHLHLESNTVSPLQSAPYYARDGVTLLVHDPHEIANTGGVEYVKWFVDLCKQSPLRYAHGVPSSVPSDPNHEVVGTDPFGVDALKELFDFGCTHLAEVMAYIPYINGAAFVHELVNYAVERGFKVDGHAVKINAEQAAKFYEGLRISTNHECTEIPEAEAQLLLNAMCWVRRGSAADNSPLLVLMNRWFKQMGFCTDDLHPDAVLAGQGILSMLRDAIFKFGVALNKATYSWSYVPRIHYGVGGLLRVGDPVDLVVLEVDSIDSPGKLDVVATYVDCELLAENGVPTFEGICPGVGPTQSTWRRTKHVHREDFQLQATSSKAIALKPSQGSLIKEECIVGVTTQDGILVPDIDKDLALVGSLNRYQTDAKPSVMLLSGFGVTKPFAMVTSVAHDRHSPLFLGTDVDMIVRALNLVIDAKGGLALVSEDDVEVLPLPIAGLMSNDPIEVVGEHYARMEKLVSEKLTYGRVLTPYMLLSFMGLIVIPDYGIGDDGLYRMGAAGPERVDSIFV